MVVNNQHPLCDFIDVLKDLDENMSKSCQLVIYSSYEAVGGDSHSMLVYIDESMLNVMHANCTYIRVYFLFPSISKVYDI